jgi:hypothetical protein
MCNLLDATILKQKGHLLVPYVPLSTHIFEDFSYTDRITRALTLQHKRIGSEFYRRSRQVPNQLPNLGQRVDVKSLHKGPMYVLRQLLM